MLLTLDLDALVVRCRWLAWLAHCFGFFSWSLCAEVNQLIVRVNTLWSACDVPADDTLFHVQDRLAWGVLKRSMVDAGSMQVPSQLHTLLSRAMRKRSVAEHQRRDTYAAWLSALNQEGTWRQWRTCVSDPKKMEALKSQWLCWGSMAKLSVSQSLEMWQALTSLADYFNAVVRAGRWRFFWWCRSDYQVYQSYAISSLKIIDAALMQLQGFMQYALPDLVSGEAKHPVKRLTEELQFLGVSDEGRMPEYFPDSHLSDIQRHQQLQIVMRDVADVSGLQSFEGGRLALVLWKDEWLWMPPLGYRWLLMHHGMLSRGVYCDEDIVWVKKKCQERSGDLKMICRILHASDQGQTDGQDDGMAVWCQLKAMQDALAALATWLQGVDQSRAGCMLHADYLVGHHDQFQYAYQGWWVNWLKQQRVVLHQKCLDGIIQVARLSVLHQHAWMKTPMLFQMVPVFRGVMSTLRGATSMLQWPSDMSWAVLQDFYQWVEQACRLELLFAEGFSPGGGVCAEDEFEVGMQVEVVIDGTPVSVCEALQSMVRSWVQQAMHPASQCLLQLASRHVPELQAAWMQDVRALIMCDELGSDAVRLMIDRLLQWSGILCDLHSDVWVSDRFQLLFLVYLRVHCEVSAMRMWPASHRMGVGLLLRESIGGLRVLGQSVYDVLEDLDVFYQTASWSACQYKARQVYASLLSSLFHAWCDRASDAMDQALQKRLQEGAQWQEGSWSWFLAVCGAQAERVKPSCEVQALCLSGSDEVHVQQFFQKKGIDMRPMMRARATLMAMRDAFDSPVASSAMQSYALAWVTIQTVMQSQRVMIQHDGMNNLLCLYHMMCRLDANVPVERSPLAEGSVFSIGLGESEQHADDHSKNCFAWYEDLHKSPLLGVVS